MEPKNLEKKSKPSQEGEVPFNMNNFHLNLPDGGNRQFKGSPEVPSAMERTRVMDAIDELLAGEFANLDVSRISKTIFDAGKAVQAAVNSGNYRTREALEGVVGSQLEAAKQAREELRPLFNKLVELGFSPELLAR